MTEMRSIEPLTGIDAILARLLPFLNGTEPRPGERGCDRNGLIYRWEPGRGWVPTPETLLEAEAGRAVTYPRRAAMREHSAKLHEMSRKLDQRQAAGMSLASAEHTGLRNDQMVFAANHHPDTNPATEAGVRIPRQEPEPGA
jgi:hypothetical protein